LSVSERALGGQLDAGPFTRERMVAAGLGLLALLLVVLIVHDVVAPPTPAAAGIQTVTARRGTVSSAISGTGTLVPVAQQNVGFSEAGTLAQINVKVGDKVTKGQTLARLDTTTLQQALDQANNGLTTAQANLNNSVNSNQITQLQHSLSAAQQSLSDTQASVNLTSQQDQQQLSTDQQQYNTDWAALQKCNAAPPAAGCASAQAAVTADLNKIAADQNKIANDQLAGQRSINQANNAVTSAQDALDSASIQRPNNLAAQQASLSNAQIAVDTAQRNLNNAVLTAPLDGTIMSINGQVGENVAAGGGATAQAPGSTAPQPTGSGSTSSSSSASGGAFMVISNVSGMEVIAPFAEADAARLAANQTATITFDAVSGLTVPAHVLAVASNATVISNVTNYYATLVVDQIDPRLKSGMTANANVIVQSVQGVIALTNRAITHVGNASFVNLLNKDGKTETRVAVRTGVVGDSTTEIQSGLNIGDQVVLPSLKAPSATSGAGRGGGGFGGGGTVRIGGGG
jgi:HlyD family secretion protein